MSTYIKDFFFISNNSKVLAKLKKTILNKYNIKHFRKVSITIKWQITKELKSRILKIVQSVFIHNLFKNKNIIDYNIIVILIKMGCFIKMQKTNNYKEVEIKIYK